MSKIQLNCVENNRLELSGQVDFSNVIDLYHDGCKHITRCNTAEIHIGLHDLQVSNSACLALFTAWLRYANQYDKDICYNDIPSAVMSMATISGVNAILFGS